MFGAANPRSSAPFGVTAVKLTGPKIILALMPLLAFGLAAGDVPPRSLTEPGVLLTFDDMDVEGWVKAIPILEKYDAHATFFVTRFDQLSEKQVDGLRQLSAAGHAIGCHGLRHLKAAEYSEAHGIEAYIDTEVTPALDDMNRAGFTPTSFAYPSSNNNATTDEALLKTFRHMRTGAFPKNGQRYAELDVIFTPSTTWPNVAACRDAASTISATPRTKNSSTNSSKPWNAPRTTAKS